MGNNELQFYNRHFMKNKKLLTEFNLLQLIFFLVSLACHMTAAFQYLLIFKKLQIGSEYFNQFFILLGVSLLISLILVFIGEKKHVIFIMLFHLVVFILIGYPLADYINIELVLLTTILIEVIFFTIAPYNLVIALSIIILTILLQRPVLAWHKTLPAPRPDGLILLGLYSVLIFTFSFILKSFFKDLQQCKSQVSRMDEAVKQLMNANIGFQQYAKKNEETSKISERKRVAFLNV